MRIGVFVPTNPEHAEVLMAFAEGCDGEIYATETYRECDVAVVFGVHKEHVPASWPRGRIIAEQRDRGRPVLILEKGYVRRDQYYACGIGGLNGMADFCNADSPDDRWRLLNTPLKPWRGESYGHVVICQQVPWDASVQHTDVLQWAADTAESLLRDGETVIYRPHPKCRNVPNIPGTIMSTRQSLAEDLLGAKLCVTYNSNSGVESVIAGIPTTAAHEGSMIWPLVETGQKRPDRAQWAHDLAYTQWTVDEMRAGLAWEHIQKGLK